ncbi:uncharacterized protein LOC131641032 [Vicia villosa]|uniref:uncharacterized protein LOC131641032 n=1 Tax=Vicia villosa TaxID=3911 RepID=UPI00273A806E|nr:uncharacterized protein LOC131641032 [Vicia villosa]
MAEDGGATVDSPELNVRFDCLFHHGGEFMKPHDGEMIYRGGVTTLITGVHIERWSQTHIQKVVSGWGYEAGSFRLWTKIPEIDPNFFQIKTDSDAYDLAAFACSMRVDGKLFVEHDADIHSSKPRCVNESLELEVSDEEILEGMNDSEDERATALDDGFGLVDVTLPVSEGPLVASLLTYPSKGKEDEKEHRFEKFKKEELNKDYKFKWGMEFNTLNDFREAIREWTVLNGREITFVKNESYRVRVECKAKCGFLMLCSKVGHKHSYAIKTIKDTHTCARVLENKSASSKWVAKAVVKKMRTSDKVRICDIIQDMRQNYSVGITVCRAWKAKLIAKKIIEGDADKEYANLWRHASELHRVNPGNTVKINIERPLPTIPPRFGSFYFCFDGCKKGFTNGCRPFIGVDGCHFKTKYGGQLLIAVGRDPNDQYFPLAFGVVETETKESWRWFIQLLMEDIGQDKRIVFISDQQKKKFGGGALIRDLMMGAAKATYQQAWTLKMNELKVVDPKAWAWLMAVPTKSWCKHAFSFYPKCDVLMNNIAESFNATILNARDKPILTMCEWIRKYLMSRCSNSTLKLDKWPHKVMPIPRKRLDNEVAMSGHWLPTWAMEEKFQVTHAYNRQEFIVDIAKKNCTCNFWDLVGIPCRHAVAALGFRQQNPEEFVHEYYTRDRYAMCYGFAISPINGIDMWPEVESEELLPPKYKKGPGRPRKLRIRESGEEGARRRLPGVSYRCTKCDKVGHNVKTCKSKRQNQSAMKRKKKMRPNANEEGTSNVESQSAPINEGGQHNAGSQSATINEDNEDTKIDSLFGDVTDDMISSIPDFQSQASTSNNYKGKGKGKMIDK